jgi:hypothetical protein
MGGQIVGRSRGRLLVCIKGLDTESGEMIEVFRMMQKAADGLIMGIGVEWDTQGIHGTNGWRIGVSLIRVYGTHYA